LQGALLDGPLVVMLECLMVHGDLHIGAAPLLFNQLKVITVVLVQHSLVLGNNYW
jgi:hypothetical protein